MVIGIDIDGVIQDCENWFRTFAEIYDIDEIGNGVVNPESLRVQARMGWNDDQFMKFVYKYMHKCMKNAPIKPGAKMVIDRLKEMGHKLVVITARGNCTNTGIKLAKRMLKKNNIKVDKICFLAVDKLKHCNEEHIDYMIDDTSGIVEKLSTNAIKCLYFREYGSKDVVNENVTNVKNWGEVLRFFMALENKKEG